MQRDATQPPDWRAARGRRSAWHKPGDHTSRSFGCSGLIGPGLWLDCDALARDDDGESNVVACRMLPAHRSQSAPGLCLLACHDRLARTDYGQCHLIPPRSWLAG